MYVRIYVCIIIYVCIYVGVCVCVYMYMSVYNKVHSYTYTLHSDMLALYLSYLFNLCVGRVAQSV